MAKRFTDTSKWDKESFGELSLKMKLVWIYLCDKCDHAGVWDINIRLLSFQIGEKITLDEILSGLGDKVEIISNKLLLKSFIEFQYGTLNSENRVHKSVLERLAKLEENKDLISPLQGAKDKDKDKDKDLDKDKDKDKEKEIIKNCENFFEIWNSKEKLPKAIKLSSSRIKKIKSRLKEASIEDWSNVMDLIQASPFLMGSTGWKADFDWLISNEENRLKILEGKYSNKKTDNSKNVFDAAREQLARIERGEL